MQLVESRRHVIDLQQNRLKRLRHRARHTQTFWTHPRTWLVTLTYKPSIEPSKDDWSKAMQRFRKWYKSAHQTSVQPRILWVRELTKRGRLHYHAVVNGAYPGKWDKLGIWPHGSTQVKPGQGDACTAYLVKYASKLDSKLTGEFKHWRLYGFTGLNQEQRKAVSYQLLPAWVRDTFSIEQIASPSARMLVNGKRIQSGWIYGGAAYRANLGPGFDSIVYVGYCVCAPFPPATETGGGGRERGARPPRPGACFF